MTDKERQEWLAERRKYICGTDVAAILGLDEYKTALIVWQDKKGLLPDMEQNEAMRQGSDFEDYIARRFQEATGKEITNIGHNLGNPEYPFALCNPDRWIVSENAGLECKFTSSLNYRKFKDGNYPERYYTQCVHNMAVTGSDHWYLAVLIACKEFKWFEIKRNDEEIKALMEFERKFYEKYMLTDIIPDPDDSKLTTKALSAMFVDKEENDYAEKPELFSLCSQYKELDDEIKNLGKEQETVKQQIILAMEKYQTANVDDKFKVSYKTVTSRLLNREALEKKYPDILKDEEVWREQKTRPLKITQKKESGTL